MKETKGAVERKLKGREGLELNALVCANYHSIKQFYAIDTDTCPTYLARPRFLCQSPLFANSVSPFSRYLRIFLFILKFTLSPHFSFLRSHFSANRRMQSLTYCS